MSKEHDVGPLMAVLNSIENRQINKYIYASVTFALILKLTVRVASLYEAQNVPAVAHITFCHKQKLLNPFTTKNKFEFFILRFVKDKQMYGRVDDANVWESG